MFFSSLLPFYFFLFFFFFFSLFFLFFSLLPFFLFFLFFFLLSKDASDPLSSFFFPNLDVSYFPLREDAQASFFNIILGVSDHDLPYGGRLGLILCFFSPNYTTLDSMSDLNF